MPFGFVLLRGKQIQVSTSWAGWEGHVYSVGMPLRFEQPEPVVRPHPDLPGVLAIRFPTEREEELTRRFTVSLNYVDHTRLWLEDTYGQGSGVYHGLALEVSGIPAYFRVQKRLANIEAISELLRIAWATEIQLRLPETLGGAAILRYANAWAPVHAYYAVYLALQAWFEANQIADVADDHSASLRTVSSQIDQRRLFPPPWSVLCLGCPMRQERSYLHEPHGADCSQHLEVLGSPRLDEFWPRYGTWLRTAREARLIAREEDWKRENGRKRISPGERTRIASRVWPTSLFDCLWKMRVRSNYRTVAPYFVRFISDDDARRFHEGLVTITGTTLALLELYIARAIGASEFGGIVRDFSDVDVNRVSKSTVGARVDAYRAVIPAAVRT